MSRYFLSQDNSSHWYVIPLSRQADWERFTNLPEDDEEGWDVPTWAEAINGGPERITFTKDWTYQ